MIQDQILKLACEIPELLEQDVPAYGSIADIHACWIFVLCSPSYQRIMIRNMANSRAYLKRIAGASNNAEIADAERFVFYDNTNLLRNAWMT